VDYSQFIEAKSQIGGDFGFDPVFMPDFLFDFQKSLVEWATRKGRAGIFADCGLGKTPMQLVWAENVARQTNGNILILTPLAVSYQTCREAEKFGIEVHRSGDGSAPGKITVANYERLSKFDPAQFVGCVCDESSILKSFDGVRRQQITDFMRKMKYRLLCTATAAPNDFIELGTSSEALGYLGHVDMLSRFFKNENGNAITAQYKRRHHGKDHQWFGDVGKWRLKGHAAVPFWKWVCSWALAVRKPSDMGFDDDGFILPPLVEHDIVVNAHTPRPGFLFELPAVGLREQREERRHTIRERCERVAEIAGNTTGPVLVWCHLNPEGDLLESLIPDSVQISGADSDDSKEAAFCAFVDGGYRVLITKPKIGAWGLNFQHCADIITFPSHSYESYYQAIRRCWRFGQKNPVNVTMVHTEGESEIIQNLQRKADQADRMFSNLVNYMGQALSVNVGNNGHIKGEIPSWM